MVLEKHEQLNELNDNFIIKQNEIESLKTNLDKLNEDFTNLNEKLFCTKHTNLNLKDDICSLRQQIEFYKSLNDNRCDKKTFSSDNNYLNLSLDSNLGSSNDMCSSPKELSSRTSCQSSGICVRQASHTETSISTSTSSLDSNSLQLSDDNFPMNNSYDDFFKTELGLIKSEIRAEYEMYMNIELDIFEDDCEANFYQQLTENENEYEEMYKQRDKEFDELTDDLRNLNNEYLKNFSEFIQLNNENSKMSERLVNLNDSLINFSKSNSNQCELVMLKYSLNSLKKHINENKVDVERFEVRLTNLKNLLFNKNIDYILNENLLLKSIKTIIPISQLRSMLNINSNLLAQQLFEVSYTQTNLFGYVQFNFNLNHKTSSITIKQNKIDTSVLIIENLDKVLDLDLSEWILKREIYDALKITKSPKELDQIEFKFPKGFKLKRRKKLILLSMSAKLNDYQIKAPIHSKSQLTSPQSKCVLPSKIKDTDLFYCSNIPNWGCGLQIVTKLINNKNMTKYVNYKSFKSIWSNL